MKQIRKSSIVDQITKTIIEELQRGTWKAGSQLPAERELTETLGVSRNALRESLKQLEFMGLLSVRQGEGTFVNELNHTLYFKNLSALIRLDDAAIFELIEARRAVEGTTSRLAALRATESDLEAMKQLIEKSEQLVSDHAAFTKLDTEFHHLVARASHNKVLLHLFMYIREALSEQQELIALIPGIPKVSVHYHRRIFESIQTRDGDAAASIMDEHIQNVLARLQLSETHSGNATAAPKYLTSSE